MTKEELDRLWAICKEGDKKRKEDYEALSEDEKKHLFDGYDKGFLERTSENLAEYFEEDND
ncbi:MAG: hypothetical protein LUE27_10030 [Clostridia bacterium]|nr:hypothetical protein [Clostridia bacterium]